MTEGPIVRKQIFYWFGVLVTVCTGVLMFSDWVHAPVNAAQLKISALERQVENLVTEEQFNTAINDLKGDQLKQITNLLKAIAENQGIDPEEVTE